MKWRIFVWCALITVAVASKSLEYPDSAIKAVKNHTFTPSTTARVVAGISAVAKRIGPNAVATSSEQLRSVLHYKPPVGIVALFMTFRLLIAGRLFRGRTSPMKDIDFVLSPLAGKLGKRRGGNGKIGLTKNDRSSFFYGGVEGTRCLLCLSLLRHFLKKDSPLTGVMLATQALSTFKEPGQPRISVVYKMLPLLDDSDLSESKAPESWPPDLPDDPTVLRESIRYLAGRLVEIRALDTLLRSYRDYLLKSLVHLRRSRNIWESRLQRISAMPPFSAFATQALEQRCRHHLVMVKLELRQELAHLGQIMSLLTTRPLEMSDDDLLRTGQSQGSLHIKAHVGDALLAYSALVECQVDDWLKESRVWSRRARLYLYELLMTKHATNAGVPCKQLQEWKDCKAECRTWECVVDLVSDLEMASDSHVATLVESVQEFVRFVDICGIPSSLVSIGVASVANKMIAPHWKGALTFLRKGTRWIRDLFHRRMWLPFKQVFHAYASKKNSAFYVLLDTDNELTSLDNMLRDLGLGKGSRDDRDRALRLATRKYERLMKRGIFANLVRGRLFRLTLMQVQQLKAGLLRALEDIDSMVQATRLNARILAAIPAVVLLTFTTRFLVRTIVRVRIGDLRPLRQTHRDMGDYLYQMEKLLVSAQHPTVFGPSCSSYSMKASDLGQFTLLVHLYLVLLDHCAPAFSAPACNFIRRSLTEIVEIPFHHLRPDQQVALLRLVRENHADLYG